ncbi:MAG TPA: hypothetical protein VFC19_27135, partial [Candidatus Limnocylindrales bacterium]|nr:hypothetical protein [Candidatus Limnocylindrales bacterium]
ALDDISAKADATTDADSRADSDGGGLLQINNFRSNASTAARVEVTVATGSRLEAGDLIEISATHNRTPVPGSQGTFDGATGVDPSNGPTGNSITFAVAHGLTTGAVVTYDSHTQQPVGGLANGREYGVIVPAGSTVTVQLGAAFNGASVDPATDTITFATPHLLNPGDLVFYFAGPTAVGGLVSGQQYEVTVIDELHIKLRIPGSPIASATVPGTAIGTNTVTVAGNPFANGDPVTYHAPGPTGAFSSVLVDAQVDGALNLVRLPSGEIATEDNNTIYLARDIDGDGVLDDHGIQTGQQILYVASDPSKAIGGLVSGTTYVAIRVDARRIRLATMAAPTVAIALNPNKTTAGRGVLHTLRRAADGSLPNLVDGRVYFVINRTATSFQLAATPGGAAIALNPGALTGGPHSFAREGINLTSTGGGTQKLVLDLTAPSTGIHQLSSEGADDLHGAPSGDQVVTASSSGSGFGGLDVGGSTATASATPTVKTTIQAATLTAARISVLSDAVALSRAVSSSGGLSVINVGGSIAIARAGTDSSVEIKDGAVLTATGDLAVKSRSELHATATSSPTKTGLLDFLSAHAAAYLDYRTATIINGRLAAGGALQLDAVTVIDGRVDARASVLGLGADAEANDDGGNPRTLEIGQVRGETLVEIQTAARLTGATVTVTASVDSLRASATSRSHAGAGYANVNARSEAKIGGSAEVVLAAGSITTGNVVSLVTRYLNVDLFARSDASCSCGGGDTDSHALITYDTRTQVTGRAGAAITTSDLSVSSTQAVTRFQRIPAKDEAFFDSGGSGVGGSYTPNRYIFWEATVNLLGEANPELEIDRTGRIVKMVNIAARDETGVSYRLGQIIAGNQIRVQPIAYDESNGRVRLFANDPGPLNDLNRVVTPPASVIWGNAAVFAAQGTFGFVRITNYSPKTLITGPINVVNLGDSRVQIDVIADQIRGPVATPPFGVSLDEDIPGVTFEFDIRHTFPATQVEIRNLQPNPAVAFSAVVINGAIENPVGRTYVKNERGDIVSGITLTGGSYLIRTNILELDADFGYVGLPEMPEFEAPRRPIAAELVQYVDAAGVRHLVDLLVEAYYDVVLDLTGNRREIATDAFVLPSGYVRAGNDVDIFVNSSVEGTDLPATGGTVRVNLFDPQPSPPDLGPLSGSGDYRNHFRPDGPAPTDAVIRAFGTVRTPVASTWLLSDVRAGRTIDIRHDTGGTGGTAVAVTANTDADASLTDLDTGAVVSVADGVGMVNVFTNGVVLVVEQSGRGDLRVGRIVSTHNNVTLSSGRMIIDDDSTQAGLDVAGVNITMTAGTDGGQGGVGVASEYLEIDVDVLNSAVPGLLRVVDTAGSSSAGVFLIELTGALFLDVVDTDGDVSLVTFNGSILDGRGAGSGLSMAGVLGRGIDLVANYGSIGAASGLNDVEIDSSRGGSGRVGLIADGAIAVTETDGVLRLLLAEGTDIRITVRESSDVDEDLDLSGSGTVRKGEGQSRPVPNAKILASAGDVALRVGDDISTDAASQILASGRVDIYGDDVNLDAGAGTTIVLRGQIIASKFNPALGHLIRVFGNADADFITFDGTDLGAKTRAFGGDGEDTFTVQSLRSMDVAGGHTLTLDGQARSDTCLVWTTGSRGDRRHYVVNVLDTGPAGDGVDTVSVFGGDNPAASDTTPADDIFLLRRATSIPNETADRPGYVALVHGTLAQHRDLDRTNAPSEVQRVNYDAAIEGRLSVFGLGGNDYFAVDDTSVPVTLDGGANADMFQIGQLYGNKRDVTEGKLAAADVFPNLIATTRGWLSPGVGAPLVAHGDTGRDVFTVYASVGGEVRLAGDGDDDTFEVRAFALAVVVDTDANNDGLLNKQDVDNPTVDRNGDGVINAADAHTTDTWLDDVTILDGMAARPVIGRSFTTPRPDDIRTTGIETQVRYVANAPVSVDGDGNSGGGDRLTVVGTEFADLFAVTERTVMGAGLHVRYSGIETLDVDGMEGDDSFGVVGTGFGVATKVIGGAGTDVIDVVPADQPVDVSTRELEGTSSIVNHWVRSTTDTGYDRIVVSGVDLNLAGAADGLVIVIETGGLTAAREGATDSYSVRLAKAPTGTVYLTVTAEAPTRADGLAGGDTVLVSTSSSSFTRAVTLVFTPANWNVAQTVNVLAVDDAFAEGDRTVVISHQLAGVAVRNVQMLVRDNDRAGLILTEVLAGTSTEDGRSLVLEGDTTATAIADDILVELAKAPATGKTVVVQVVWTDLEVQVTSTDPRFSATTKTITFTSTDWNSPVRLTVKAKQDTVVEDLLTSLVTFKRHSSSTDGGYSFTDQTVDVDVADDDKPGVLVQPTDGATLVGGGLTDSYTVRLTKKPSTGTVTVAITGDGQTDVRTINGAAVTLVLIGEFVPVQLFNGSVTFNPGAKTLTRGGGSFLTDGFAAGMPIRIMGTNAGDYTIASVTATVMTLTTTFPTSGLASNVKIFKLVPNGVFNGMVSFDAVNNRLTRTDGGSWLADGFLEGQRVRIAGVGDFKIALIRGTNGTKDNVLQFTAERTLPAQAPSMKTITRLGAVLTFTTTNWNVAQTVELQTDTFYAPPLFRKGLKDFARQPSTPGRIHSPVTQVPDTTTADRSLKTAVKLPKEADANLRPIGGDPSATLTGSYEITHSDEEWGNKFEAKLVITNMTSTAQNWTVTLTFPPRVTGLAAVWVDGQANPTAVRNGQTWTITGAGPVPPGGTITLMLQFFVIPRQPGDGEPNPSDCRVNDRICEMP